MTTQPATRPDCFSGSLLATHATENAKGGILFERTASYGRGSIHFVTDNNASNSNADISDAAMTIFADGSVGIGVSVPNSKFAVNGPVQSFNSSVYSSSAVVSIQAGTGSSGSTVRRLRYGGVGNNANKFEIQGPGDAMLLRGDLGSSAIYRVNNSSSWNTTSDERIKTDISNLDNALEKITQLRPVTFKWKEDYIKNTNAGLI